MVFGQALLVVSSVTYAMKGRDLLFRHGIRGYVERIPGQRKQAAAMESTSPGADAAERILWENHIRVLRRMEQDGETP